VPAISSNRQQFPASPPERLDSLAKIPELRVAARTSSFQFKGKGAKLADIGRELKVATVLEGSVRKEGRRVRISAQLVKVSDGFDLWSDTYDRELNDIFAVQEEIARSVAASLKVTLLGPRTPSSRGTNAEAYNAYLQGQYFRVRRTEEDLRKSIGYYEQAINFSPGYALAWAGLAGARTFQVTIGYLPFDEGCRKARAAAESALALDASLADAQVAMGNIKLLCNWDWTGADASYQRAAALEPGNVAVLDATARLRAAKGRFKEALALRRQVVELDPLNPPAHIRLGINAYRAGQLEEAVAAFKKALELNPDNPAVHNSLGRVYLDQSDPEKALAEMDQETARGWRLQGLALAYDASGRKKESDAALAELIEKFQADMAFQIAEVYAFRGESDRAFEWLDRAYAQHDTGLIGIKGDLLLKSLERDPRYVSILNKMGLPT
jgi:tetratricopeptide (TPR) repeat protein